MNIDQYMLFNKERHVSAKSFFIRFILIKSFRRTFPDELSLPEIVGKFAEINYFKDQRH